MGRLEAGVCVVCPCVWTWMGFEDLHSSKVIYELEKLRITTVEDHSASLWSENPIIPQMGVYRSDLLRASWSHAFLRLVDLDNVSLTKIGICMWGH